MPWKVEMIYTGKEKTRNDINIKRVILHEKKASGNKAKATEKQAATKRRRQKSKRQQNPRRKVKKQHNPSPEGYRENKRLVDTGTTEKNIGYLCTVSDNSSFWTVQKVPD